MPGSSNTDPDAAAEPTAAKFPPVTTQPVGVEVTEGVGVMVAVRLGVEVAVGMAVIVRVGVTVGVRVTVGDKVLVEVAWLVAVGRGVWVLVGKAAPGVFVGTGLAGGGSKGDPVPEVGPPVQALKTKSKATESKAGNRRYWGLVMVLFKNPSEVGVLKSVLGRLYRQMRP